MQVRDQRTLSVSGPAGAGRSRRTGALLWILAVVITLAALVYQRIIGPTRPVRGTVTLGTTEIDFRLARTHGGSEDHELALEAADRGITGTILFRRFKTDDPWTRQEMTRRDDHLVAHLPHQPMAGKIIYRVHLARGGEEVVIPPLDQDAIVIRFRGHVPVLVLVPHVILMFLSMLWSNRAGIEALRPGGNVRRLTFWSLGLLFVGGMIFGPAVQWYAFGAAWTGFPFGHDLTDNKTLIAVLAWVLAVIAVLRWRARARGFVVAAAIVTLGIFSIPHSVLGSELDYSKLPEDPPVAAPFEPGS